MIDLSVHTRIPAAACFNIRGSEMPPYVARSRHLLKLKELMDRVFVAFVLFSVLASAKTYTHLPEDVTYYDSIPCEHEGEWCGVDNGKW